MSVHYKFKSALDYDTVTFDGLHISVGDLKAAISQQKRIGKTYDFDLQITNAQTKEVYSEDSTLIPKNTSLVIARVPLSQQPKKYWDGKNSDAQHKDVSVNKGLADLVRMEGSEQDKINAMISQSTFDYDPSNYQKIRGQNQRGPVPPNYTCYKCHKRGHWIKDCPLSKTAGGGEPVEIRRSTGIPRSFMVPVEGPKAQGAMMTPSGTFAVPVVDREAYLASENAGGAEAASTVAVETAIPDELICSLCRDLLTDAVMIPCCGNSFCDECIRGALLDSEDHECPDCREKEISPTTLIPNRFLRTNVSLFRNETGYIRRVPHRPTLQPQLAPAGPVITHPTTTQSTNGVAKEVTQNNESEVNDGTSSEGSGDDNITVTVPPAHAHRGRRMYHPHHRHPGRRIPHRYDHPPNAMANSGLDAHPSPAVPVMEEPRSSTPTVDERRDVPPQMVFRNSPPFMPDVPPSHFNPAYPVRRGPPGSHPNERYRNDFQPPPPGLKDSPNNVASVDPLEAFNRMIREKEARAKRREEERRRLHSPLPRSPSRTPPSRARSRSPPSILPPRARTPLSRGSSRLRYSRSRSKSRGRLRRSPWTPRRRRSRDRSITFSRSPSPRRRHRSPLRYRTPLRSPPRDDRTPPRPRPPSRNLSPQRYAGVYADLMTSPLRSVEPPFLARYPRNNGPPTNFPPMAPKTIPSLMSQHQEPGPVGFRGRYDGPPPFEEVTPGIDPPIPGYEPSPFDKQPFPPNLNDRDRLLPPPNYREPFRQFPENQVGYRDVGLPPGPNDMPVHVDQRYREGFRGAPPFRDQINPPFREGQPPFRDHAYRGPPPAGYRDNAFRNNSQMPFRDAPPGNYRDNPPNYRDGPGQYRRSREPPNIDHREPVVYDANYRENFREIPQDDSRKGREHSRDTHKSNRHRADTKRGSDYSRRDRDNRDRNTSKDRSERSREGREERPREERYRDYDKSKDRERDTEKSSPDKRARESPKHTKRRSDSRGRSRDRDSKRVRKEERTRDRSSTDRNRDHSHKDKDKKIKDKKKKKKEKEEKKKKKDKKEKDRKDKDAVKKEEGTTDGKDVEPKKTSTEVNVQKVPEGVAPVVEDTECGKLEPDTEATKENGEPPKVTNLYDEETSTNIDKNILDNYVQEPVCDSTQSDVINKEESFDGIDLQIQPDELDLKDIESNDKEMLAPMPELSKWEVDEDAPEKFKEPGEISSPDDKEGHDRVTTEIIRRAEKAIFTKTSKPIEIKKISSDRIKLYSDDGLVKDIQVTVADAENRSIEQDKVKHRSKTPPPKLSIKDRLGGKVDDRKPRDSCVIHSTVERVDSRSKTPKKEYPYRRVTLDRGPRLLGKIESNVQQRRLASEAVKADRNVSEKRRNKDNRVSRDGRTPSSENVQNMESAIKVPASRERKSTLDEANFEPDYDETLESESEVKSEIKKRERSSSESRGAKKIRLDEGLKLDKKKTESSSDSSSDSDSSSSSSSSDRKRKRKKKHSKKKRKRAASDSESDSGSSSDDHKKKKKKRKHKKKSSKKKKKSKHK